MQHLLDTFIKQLLFNTAGISLTSFKLFPVVEVSVMNQLAKLLVFIKLIYRIIVQKQSNTYKNK